MYCTVRHLKEALAMFENKYRISTNNYKGNIDVIPDDTDEVVVVISLGSYDDPYARVEIRNGYEYLFDR